MLLVLAGSGALPREPAAVAGAAEVQRSARLGAALPARLPPTSGRHGLFWVDGAHGSDRGDGSRRHPWRTISKALAAVPLSGSVIKVLPGTYESTRTRYALVFNRHGDVRDPVTVTAARRGTVTIVNGDERHPTVGAWIVHATGLRIIGLRFRVVTARDTDAAATSVLVEDSSRIEIDHSIFNEATVAGIVVRGGANRPSEDVWAIGNVFRPSGPNPTAQVTGAAFGADDYFGTKGSHWIYAGQYQGEGDWNRISGSRRLVVVNNVFTGSAAGCDVQLGPQSRHAFVVDNTFYGNRSADAIGPSSEARYAGQAIELFSNTSRPEFTNGYNTIANNLFVNLHGHAVAGSGLSEPQNVVKHNLAWEVAGHDSAGPSSSPMAPTSGSAVIFEVGRSNRTLDPRFVAPGRYDFRLRRSSPALRAADPSLAYPYDARGRARPPRPALGALEPT